MFRLEWIGLEAYESIFAPDSPETSYYAKLTVGNTIWCECPRKDRYGEAWSKAMYETQWQLAIEHFLSGAEYTAILMDGVYDFWHRNAHAYGRLSVGRGTDPHDAIIEEYGHMPQMEIHKYPLVFDDCYQPESGYGSYADTPFTSIERFYETEARKLWTHIK